MPVRRGPRCPASWLNGRHGAAKETAIFRLPPGITDGRFTLADRVIIPLPHFRLDRLSDRGHVFEVIVVFLRLVRAKLSQGADAVGAVWKMFTSRAWAILQGLPASG